RNGNIFGDAGRRPHARAMRGFEAGGRHIECICSRRQILRRKATLGVRQPVIDIPVAAAAAQRILKESLDAFVNGDAALAHRVMQDDRYIDDVCEQMLRELLTYMFEDPSTV